VAAFDYVPFSKLFDRAVAVVHHGGIGTTGFALRSSKPALVVPRAHDQPDTAYRLARLGVARVIPWNRYSAHKAACELDRLIQDPSYQQRASEIGAKVQREDGVSAACDALETLMGVANDGTRQKAQLGTR
jgi:UDP:flavonoid glycosyltransferase YjiC (YdhE family)